jgi:WD40 repeat protein
VTGHKGGDCDIKLWDLKKLDHPIFTFSEHTMTPQARFLKTGGGQIISAGLDAQLNVLNTKGLVSNNKKAARGFTCLETLPTTANSKVGLEPHLQIIVCADTS